MPPALQRVENSSKLLEESCTMLRVSLYFVFFNGTYYSPIPILFPLEGNSSTELVESFKEPPRFFSASMSQR